MHEMNCSGEEGEEGSLFRALYRAARYSNFIILDDAQAR